MKGTSSDKPAVWRTRSLSGLKIFAKKVRMSSEMTLVSSRFIAHSKSGGARIALRGGSSRSTLLMAANRSPIARPRFFGVLGSATAWRRISRASSSIDRPCSAARTRNRRFTSSSRLRIVMLAV